MINSNQSELESYSALFRNLMEIEGISELNTYQRGALENGLLGLNNFILCTPVTTGKTFSAKLAASKVLEKGMRVIYVSPTRALSTQIALEFSSFGKIKTYDREVKIKNQVDLEAEIQIFTAEKLKNELNNPETDVLDRIGLIIIDELHLIKDAQRGVDLFYLILRLLHEQNYNIKFRILTMSASIDNIEYYQKLFNADIYYSRALKDNVTYYTVSTDNTTLTCTRYKRLDKPYSFPRQEKEEYEIGDETHYYRKYAWNPKQLGILLLLHNLRLTNKSLVYCTSRKEAIKLHKAMKQAITDQFNEKKARETEDKHKIINQSLQAELSKIVLHHGKLGEKKREIAERKLHKGSFSIVFSTSTLIYGLNVNFDTLILSSKGVYSEFRDEMDDIIDINQVIGRIGRFGQPSSVYAFGDEAEAILDYVGMDNLPLPKLHFRYGLQAIQRELLFLCQLENFTIKDLVNYFNNIQLFYEDSEIMDAILYSITQFLFSPFVKYKDSFGKTISDPSFDIISYLTREQHYDTIISLSGDWKDYLNKKYSIDQFTEVLRRYCAEETEFQKFDVLRYVVHTDESLKNEIKILGKSDVDYYLSVRCTTEEIMREYEPEEYIVLRNIAYLIKFMIFCYISIHVVYTGVYGEITRQTIHRYKSGGLYQILLEYNQMYARFYK
ncbi:MAG: DEAD/DEAH box helicase [Candidatus Heimdallarchaeota archaeon]|nr:DEAD/DEAH box helicase [Candidatus Heimdallarchaeota archaeon]